MEQKTIDKYNGRDKIAKYAFPSDDINPEEKSQMQYYVACLQNLFTLGINGFLSGTFNAKNGCFEKYDELRNYAKGTVDVSRYKKELLGKDAKGNQREKSYMNISWKQDTGHVKTRDQMRGVYEKMDFEMIVKAVDPSSEMARKKEIAALKIWLDEEFNSFVNAIGVKVDKPKQSFEDTESIDIFVKSGGLKLKTEIALKKAIDCTLSESKWRVLKMQLMDDLIDLGIVMVKDYVDKSDNIPMLRYVNPKYTFVPKSQYLDYRDITKAAELRKMTIADVRNESDLSEAKLMMIAKEYGYNEPFNTTSHSAYKEANGCFPYDHITVDILDGAWLSSDIQKYTEKVIEKFGNLEYKKRDFNYTLPPAEAKKGKVLKENRFQYIYEAKWIVGTSFAFGYGRQDKQIRKGDAGYKKAILPYHVATTGTMSKVERMIPDVDTINICKFKRNNALAAIPAPPSLIFNKTALENTEIDGEIKTPIDLMNMFLEKGIMSLDTVDTHGNPIANIHSLVTSIPITVFEQFRIYSEQIREARLNIQLTTGINDMADGSADSERMLKAQGEAKLEAANNAMQPEYAMMRETMENVCASVALRWQEVVREKPTKKEFYPINESDIDILELYDDVSDIKFGIKITIGSTYQERQILVNKIHQYSLARATNGYGGLAEDAALMLERTVMSGNIPLAQLQLSKALKEQEKLDQAKKDNDIKANGEQQRMSAAAATDGRIKEILATTASTMTIAHNQFIYDANLEAVKADLKDGSLENEALRQQVLSIANGIAPDVANLSKLINPNTQQQPQDATMG
jgi:hypothetical protein